MFTPVRLIWVALSSAAFAAASLSAVESSVSITREVIELREAVPGLNDASDVDSMLNILAPMQMRVIGANDDTWTRANPNWAPVLQLISGDLKKDLAPALAEQTA